MTNITINIQLTDDQVKLLLWEFESPLRQLAQAQGITMESYQNAKNELTEKQQAILLFLDYLVAPSDSAQDEVVELLQSLQASGVLPVM